MRDRMHIADERIYFAHIFAAPILWLQLAIAHQGHELADVMQPLAGDVFAILHGTDRLRAFRQIDFETCYVSADSRTQIAPQ